MGLEKKFQKQKYLSTPDRSVEEKQRVSVCVYMFDLGWETGDLGIESWEDRHLIAIESFLQSIHFLHDLSSYKL